MNPLWLMWDCETTGLIKNSPPSDEVSWLGLVNMPFILEAAWKLARPMPDGEVKVYSEGHAYVDLPSGEQMPTLDPVVEEMHRKSGLWVEWEAGPRIGLDVLETVITDDITDFREAEDHGNPPRLAGSGVASYDKPLTAHWLPVLHGQLHYRSVDLTNLREILKAVGIPMPDSSTAAHRAEPDMEQAFSDAERLLPFFAGHRIELREALGL